MLGLELFAVVAGDFIDVAALDGVAEWIYAAVRVAVAITGALIAGAIIRKIKTWLWGKNR